jgi:ribose-phosphate pyrophosphokinase
MPTHDTTLHVFDDTRPFGRAMARCLRLRVAPVRVHRFPDGESLPRVGSALARHAVLVRSLRDPNAKLVEVLLAADALRRAGARRVTLVAPYLPYLRQDALFGPGEPISARVVGRLLAEAFDRVLAVEAHLHRLARLSDVTPGRSLSAAPALAGFARRLGRGTLLVGPDRESARWVGAVARRAGLAFVVGQKRRSGDRRVRVSLPPLPRSRRVLVLDDVASTGVTLAETVRALRRAGARDVSAAVVHAVFVPGAEARVRAAGVDRLVSCDTVPHPTNGISVVPLLAAALR